jgi:hypothetical protein
MRSLSLNRHPGKLRRGRANNLDYTKIKVAHNEAKAAYNYYSNVPNRSGTSRFYGSTRKKAEKNAQNYSNRLKGTYREALPRYNPVYSLNRSRSASRSRSGSRSSSGSRSRSRNRSNKRNHV